MVCLRALGWSLLLVVVASARVAQAATPDEIQAAIGRAVDWIYSQQTAEGHWEVAPGDVPKENNQVSKGGQWGGRTAMATYALLAAGQSPQDPRLIKAIDWLTRAQMTGIYAVAMRCQVWSLLPTTPTIQQLARKDALYLMNAVHTTNRAMGHYPYYPGQKTYSHSRGQYGVLGVWAVAQTGMEVNPRYWQLVEAGWVQNQDRSGGWTYMHPDDTEHPVTPGMTAAGVASLFIVQDFLYSNKGLDCRSDRSAASDAAIERGMKWLIDHFDMVVSDKSYPRDFPLATIYAIERVGVASGRKYFGPHDWYARGSQWLLRNQDKDGSFKRADKWVGKLPGTCFAVLFLARGGAPVVMNKLEYTSGRDGNWNNRPRDAANVARWIGRQFERDLNWQAVNFAASAADLHDAPILYIAGNGPLNLDEAQKRTLRQYVLEGGMIVGNSDCGSRAFADSFRKLGDELFPGYEFRILPDDHLIYNNRFRRSEWRAKPQLLALSNGVRELMVLIARGDPARDWQSMKVGGAESSWQLAANLYFYAIDKRIPTLRGRTHLITADPAIKPTRRVTVARLRHGGNWDPEPAGWPRLAAYLHNRHKLGLDIRTVEPGDSLEGIRLAHLTGTAGLTLDADQKAQLKAFVEAGGTLLIDAAGGDSAFADAAEALLGELFPGKALEALPQDHALYQSGAERLPDAVYRPFARTALGNAREARLKAIMLNDRPAVIFSREDLSAGLVGQPCDGIHGYTPEAATTLASQIVSYVYR